jgi:CBS domain containing-hemolysin-like protein
MIPRTEMDCLYAYLPFEDNKQAALQKMHTRYPVCDPDKDSIIGFVHMKDLLKAPDLGDIRQIARPIISVPDLMPISSLLKLMQKQRTQIALLIDEYGGTAGLVTLEDIIEELVGEIQDEFDEERPSIERIDDETHSIDGRMRIDEVNEHFRLDIVSEDYDTIGGWIYSQIEIPPKKHQKITYQGQAEFIVEETDHMRISRIIIRKLDVQSQTA